MKPNLEVRCGCGCNEIVPPPRRPTEPQRTHRQGHHTRVQAPPLATRFASKVAHAVDLSPNGMSGCLVWTGAKRPDGYGLIWRDGTNVRAHRVAFELAGLVIPDGLQLDHLCRRRLCVNVAHLEAVPQRDNIRRGDRTKLSVAQVSEIRHLIDRGWRGADVAAAYGVGRSQASKIARRESWTDV